MVLRHLILLVLLHVQPASATAAATSGLSFDAEVSASATIGEVFRRELRIHAGLDLQFDPASLPAPARLEDGVELRETEWSVRTDEGERSYRISLSYQVFRALRGPERVQLPELALRFNRSGEPLQVAVPAGEITLTPLIPAELPDDRVSIRAPLPPVPEPLDTAWRVLIAAMALLASALLYGAWFLALFPFHGRRRKPFARAWRELPKLLRKHAHEAAFRVIHRALDHTAGYPMFADRLDVFLEAHPAFAPLRDRLQRFFAASRQLFYAPANRPRPVGANGPYDVASELKELCRLAMELERQ